MSGRKQWNWEKIFISWLTVFRRKNYIILQIRRAADSIALNVAEGSIGQSNPEFKKFVGYAIRSLAEVVTCLHKAKMRTYISEEQFTVHYDFAFNLMNMLVALKEKIK